MKLNRSIISLLIFLKLMLASNIILANTLNKAEQLYLEGDFRNSARIARTINSASAYSLAAKATLVEATFIAPDKDKLILFEQAIKDAEAALKLDANYLNAHLQIAMALGSIADLKHPITAYLKGYATQGKEHLDIALSIAPENAWANGLLGIWHLQVVNNATNLLADNIYNANMNDGLYHCEKAERSSNNNLQILYGCAISLYEFNKEPYKNMACELFEAIVKRKPLDVTESYVLQQARNKLNEKLLKQ